MALFQFNISPLIERVRRSTESGFLSRPTTRWALALSLAIVGITALGMVVYRMIPTPEPDVAHDDLATVAHFVMDKDFNRLSTSERLAYFQKFSTRFRNLSEEDTVELSRIISQMNYDARLQIEENMKSLVFDYTREAAVQYREVPPDQRVGFLRDFLLKMDKMADDFDGRERHETDPERLARIHREGLRDQEEANMRISSSAVNPQGAQFLMSMYNDEVSDSVPAQQRGMMAKFVLDLTKVRRGQNPGP